MQFRSTDVVIVEPNPAWPARFAAIRDTVVAALGELAVGVEHVGSTAVPGLAAKDVIDLDVVIRDAGDLPFAIERLAGIGYTYLGDLGVAGREAFTAPPGTPAHHLYVCAANAEELRRHLAFRDALRADPSLAAQYADLKRELAARFPHDVDTYAEEKSAFINGVLRDEREAGNRRTLPRA